MAKLERDPEPLKAIPFATRLLILIWLWGIAVAQPVYGVLTGSASFFLAHWADRLDVFLFALVYSLAAPLLLALAVWIVGLFASAAAVWLETSLWALLTGLVVAQVLRDAPLPALAAVVIAGSLGFAGAFLLWRVAGLRDLFRWLGFAAIVFGAAFVFSDSARTLSATPEGRESAAIEELALADLSVFYLIFDEFPLVSILNSEEQINASRFPHFAALAETSTWYRNATTVASTTVYAVPAMLVGRYPPDQDVILNAVTRDYPDSLFERLGDRVNFNVIEARTRLCPASLCTGRVSVMGRRTRLTEMFVDSTAVYLQQVAPRGWRDFVPAIDETWRDYWHTVDASEVDTNVRHSDTSIDEFLGEFDGLPSPALHFLHLMLPHKPWKRLPSGQMYNRRQLHGLARGRWRGSEWEVIQAQQRHLLQLGYVDKMLGKLRAKLVRIGRWDDALVIITSDHGTAFERSGLAVRRFPDRKSLAEIVNIPLFVKYPGQKLGSIDDGNAETIDIVPTILAAFGASQASSTDGLSLAEDRRRPNPKRISTGGNQGSKAGRRLAFDLERMVEDRSQVLTRNGRRFEAAGWDDVYRIGLHRDIIGRPIGEFELRSKQAEDSATVRLDWPEALLNVSLSDPVLPVHINGTVLLNDADATPLTLAVSVNDRIQSVTETFVERGAIRFTAMINPSSLQSGANRIDIFRLTLDSEQVRLTRLQTDVE